MNELFERKQLLIDQYRDIKEELLEINKEYLTEKFRLILKTDFKELGLGNQKSRDAYVDNELLEKNMELKRYEMYLKDTELELSLINDRIRYAGKLKE